MQRHPLDVVSLVFGLLFAAVALLGLTDVVRLTDTDVLWLGPGLLVVVGLILVLTAGLGRRREERDDDVLDGHDHRDGHEVESEDLAG